MTDTNVASEHQLEQPTPAETQQTKAGAVTALVDLAVELQGVTALLDTRQRLNQGIPSTDAQIAAHDALVAEQAARQAEWLRFKDAGRLHLYDLRAGRGVTAAPLNIAASSLDGDIRRTLRTHRGHLQDHFAPVWCARLLDQAATVDLIAQLIGMVRMLGTTPRCYDLAEAIATDVTDLTEQATRLLDGPAKAWAGPNTPCPHCGLPSLYMVRDDELGHVITCLKPPRAHHYAPCTCSDPLCPCKTRGIAHRHSWHDRGDRIGPPMTSWSWLCDRLGISRSAHATYIDSEDPRP